MRRLPPIRAARLFLGFFLGALAGLPAQDVVLASYNVRNYLKMDRWVDDRLVAGQPKPEPEVAAVLQVLRAVKPDILGVVEMGGEDVFREFQARLKTAGLDYPHGEWLKGADAERHVCLLSRFPIVARNSRDDVSFELDGKVERIQRGILDVTVEINPSYRLRLIGVHLKSRREVPEFDQAWLRAKEAWHVRDHVNGILAKEPEVNLALFGDFNDTKNEYPVRELIGWRGTANYLADIRLADSRGECWTHYWKTADEYSRIDYILASPGLRPEIVPARCGINDSRVWNAASDHRAIFVAISPREK